MLVDKGTTLILFYSFAILYLTGSRCYRLPGTTFALKETKAMFSFRTIEQSCMAKAIVLGLTIYTGL